ncbi:uncharacterized protein LOC143283369 [Babylonia areolata]|uniref:uncharacterized protein LOC143283369 n=1 Tax=Babylonia areolata TaxID=304850 RepID=UPI003FCFB6BC
MADEDMPPPLEDMTETLEQAKKLRGLRLGAQEHSTGTQSSAGIKTSKNVTAQSQAQAERASHSQTQSSATSTPETVKNTKSNSSTKPESAISARSTPSTKPGSGDFGGMKKGFLFGGSKSSGVSGKQQTKTGSGKSKTKSGSGDPSSPPDSIPFIQPKTQEKNSGLKLDEVQEAMESTKGFLQDKEWVTDDLLEKVSKNETLSKRLGDPRFMQAVTEFQTNPKAAMMKYQSNAEMQQFLKEFCGILGEHFISLGDKQDSQNPSQAQNPRNSSRSGPKITELSDEDSLSSTSSRESSLPVDPHVQRILEDPANREILMDSKVQQLIQYLRSDPEKAQRMLREGDSDFRHKVDRLISLGLLKFQG